MSYGTHTHTTQLRVSLGKNQEEFFWFFVSYKRDCENISKFYFKSFQNLQWLDYFDYLLFFFF